MSKPRSPLAAAIAKCYPALGATFVLSLFINATMLASPLYSMQVNDRVLSSKNVHTLLLLTGIVLAFLVLYGVLEYARSGILVRAGVHFEAALRKPLYESMMRAELSPRQRPGQQVIRDAENLRESMASGLASTLCDLPWTPVFVALCFSLHRWLGIVALTGAIVQFSLAVVTEYLTRASFERTHRLQSEASGFMASALRNGDAVRGLGMGDIVLERWSGTQSAALKAHALAHERNAALAAIAKFARVAVQTAMMGVGAWLVIEREISAGVMMASSLLMGRALAPIEQTVAQWKRILSCRSSYRRLVQLFEQHPPLPQQTGLPAPKGRISVENVVVWPPNAQRPAVKAVSMTLDPGEVTAVVGASASGKSSLARALAGVWPLRDGAIRIDGAAYTQWDPNKLGKHIGYLPQDIDLFSGTVAENIARLGKVDDAAVVAAAKAAGAHEVILRLPKGYDTPIGEGGVQLSGGMRQRVGLARALYGNPRLIILDEPNSNLDEDGEKALAEALAKMKADKRTAVVITHRPQLLAHVDKVVVMAFGQALASGPRDQVMAQMRGFKVAAVPNATKPGAAPQAGAPAAAPAARPAQAPAAAAKPAAPLKVAS